MQTAQENLVNARDRFYIDGHPVDGLFEDIYARLREPAAANAVRLKFDVIAWDPLVVAADRHALHSVLMDITMHAIDNCAEGCVTLRAFPTADESAVTFEILDERAAPSSEEDLERWSEALSCAQRLVLRMGGEFWVFSREERGMKVMFTLPHWVSLPEEKPTYYQLVHAA